MVDELVVSYVWVDLLVCDIDVILIDWYMVKLWFNGWFDYVLLVEDFVVSGFVLVGGWFDYVGWCCVVVFVYCYW